MLYAEIVVPVQIVLKFVKSAVISVLNVQNLKKGFTAVNVEPALKQRDLIIVSIAIFVKIAPRCALSAGTIVLIAV